MYSGWCTFEQSVSKTSGAHLAAARRRAAARGEALPERFARAEASRPKVTDLSGGMVRAVESEAAPEELLREGIEAVAHAKFVGKGDQGKVQGMLREGVRVRVRVRVTTLGSKGDHPMVDSAHKSILVMHRFQLCRGKRG